MAVETLILRPSSYTFWSSSTSHNSPNTTKENLHLLISEEVADDNATYIIEKNSVTGGGANFVVPNLYLNKIPIAIRLICRECTTISNSIVSYGFYVNDKQIYRSESHNLQEEYKTFTDIVPSDRVAYLWKALNENCSIQVRFTPNGSSSDKNNNGCEVRVTQAYLEIEFGNGIFVKINDKYKLAYQMFQKYDNIWTEVTCTECMELLSNTKNIITADDVVTFNIDATECKALSGMTLKEWVASDYNTYGYYIKSGGSGLYDKNGNIVVQQMYLNDIIINGAKY